MTRALALTQQIAFPASHSPDMPLRLDIAAKLAFPDGSMKAAGLRKERDRGNLVTEMIAGKEYTTLAEIERMRAKCRVQVRESVLSGGPKAANPTDRSGAKLAGTSKTPESGIPLAAARATLEKLKGSSPSMSPPSTSRRASATVIHLKS